MTAENRKLAERSFHALPPLAQSLLWHTEVEAEHISVPAGLSGMDTDTASAALEQAREQFRQGCVHAHRELAPSKECGFYNRLLDVPIRRGGALLPDVQQHLMECRYCRFAAEQLSHFEGGLGLLLAESVLGWGARRYLDSRPGRAQQGVRPRGGSPFGGRRQGGGGLPGSRLPGSGGRHRLLSQIPTPRRLPEPAQRHAKALITGAGVVSATLLVTALATSLWSDDDSGADPAATTGASSSRTVAPVPGSQDPPAVSAPPPRRDSPPPSSRRGCATSPPTCASTSGAARRRPAPRPYWRCAPQRGPSSGRTGTTVCCAASRTPNCAWTPAPTTGSWCWSAAPPKTRRAGPMCATTSPCGASCCPDGASGSPSRPVPRTPVPISLSRSATAPTRSGGAPTPPRRPPSRCRSRARTAPHQGPRAPAARRRQHTCAAGRAASGRTADARTGRPGGDRVGALPGTPIRERQRRREPGARAAADRGTHHGGQGSWPVGVMSGAVAGRGITRRRPAAACRP